MAAVEIVLRTAAVLALAALAGLMLASRRRDHTPAAGALFAASVAAFVVTSGAGASAWLGGWLVPLTALCVAKPAFFLLFARGLFAEEFRFRAGHAAIVGATAAWGSWQQLVFETREQSGLAGAWDRVLAAGFEASVLVLVVFALLEAWRGLGGDLVERRRRIRVFFIIGVSAYLSAAVLVQGYNLILQTRTPTLVGYANLILITVAAIAATWNLVHLRKASWLDPEPANAPRTTLSPLERRVRESLEELLERQRVYREEGLTIGALAERLGTREHVLRRVINQGLGYRNFNEFLHAWRIREACNRLRSAEDARLPVLSIALGVGYGSIGPFNRAFKARMGMTPTRFRRNGGAGRPV